MTTKLFTLLLVTLGLFAAALIFQNGDLLWLAFPFLFYTGAGLIQVPTAGSARLLAERCIRETSEGEPAIQVEVTIRNLGGLVPSLQVADEETRGMKITSGQVDLRTALLPGGETRLGYTVAPQRGRFTWDTLRARISDPLGLVESEKLLAAPAEISVHPPHDSFRRIPLRPNHTLHAPGSIPARRAGTGTDFWGVRLYQPGDSLRWVNWRSNARHPGQLFTKEFEQEEIANVGLILDARAETDLHVNGDSLLEHSVHAAASLADGLVGQGHQVGLLVLSKTIYRVFPGYGKTQLNRILHCLAGVQSSSNGECLGLHYLPLRIFTRGALLVVISPLARADSAFFPQARASGYQALLVSPDPYDFAAPAPALQQDRVSQQALALARQERRIQLSALARLNIPVIDWQVSQPLYPLVRSALSRGGGQREKWGGYGA